jgi:hypothetical protein
LIKLCADAQSGAATTFNTELLNSADKDSFYVTFKNYQTKTGVSRRMNNQQPDTQPVWFAKGPMGLGLQINKNGHNVAFTGGTGILVFLDVVAMLLLTATKNVK